MPVQGIVLALPFGKRKLVSTPAPSTGDAFLLESGSYLLLEDGSKLLLG